MGAERRLTLLSLSYYTNKYSFHHFLLGPFKPSPMLFGVRVFYGGGTSRCEITGLT